MKNLLLPIVAFVALLIAGCTKEQACCVLAEQVSISAQKEGIAWKATAETYKLESDSLLIIGRLPDENLFLRLKFNGKGVYTLKNSEAKLMYILGGDVVTAEYYADETATNTLDVQEYNATRGIVKGTFNVTMKRSARYDREGIAPQVKFTKGGFTMYLPK